MITHWRSHEPRAIFWHGLSRAHLLRSEEFRRLGDTHLLTILWGDSWKSRLTEEGKDTCKTRDDVYGRVVDQLLDTYEILRECLEATAADQLLEELQVRRRDTTLMDDPEELTVGLKWLALKGFALHQEGHAWAVGGLARKRFLDVFVAGWPESARKEWDRIRQDAPLEIAEMGAQTERPKHMQRRAELILEVNDVSIEEYRGSDREWDLSRHKADGLFLDVALYHWGRRLGVEPVLLRVGANRVQLEPHILQYIRDKSAEEKMTLGQRLTILRRLAGLSRAALAEDIGVSLETIGNLEKGEVQEFHDPRQWRHLAAVLGVDLFLVIAGMRRFDAVKSKRTLEERLKLFCRAEGMLMRDLQKELKGWGAQISRARRGIGPTPVFRQALLAKFHMAKPTEEELFDPESPGVPTTRIGQKPRQSSGKFQTKTSGLPETVLRNIRNYSKSYFLAEQGLLTIKGYMDICAGQADLSEGTLRRTFSKLVSLGHLVAGKPARLHGSLGYRLADSCPSSKPMKHS